MSVQPWKAPRQAQGQAQSLKKIRAFDELPVHFKIRGIIFTVFSIKISNIDASAIFKAEYKGSIGFFQGNLVGRKIHNKGGPIHRRNRNLLAGSRTRKSNSIHFAPENFGVCDE